jgi:uncharacterized protein with NRDE domain
MLAILYRTIDDCPVLVAANREEFYDRPGTAPQIWTGEPAFVAGRDPRAGGTWLGVNLHGVLIAITNRPKRHQPTPPRSRGLLCRDLLSSCTAQAANDRALIELDRQAYAGCNVLAIDAANAFVVQSDDSLQSCALPPGHHIVTVRGLNEMTDNRAAHALDRLARSLLRTTNEWLIELQRMCGDHGDIANPPICLHAPDRGTVASSIIALPDKLSHGRWLHAQGPPCRTAFTDHSHLLVQLSTMRNPRWATPIS